MAARTPVDVEKLIVREYKLGWTLREVGQTFNVDHTTVRRILKRYGVSLRKYKISGDVEAMVVALYRDKRRGVTKIAKDLGLNWKTVASALEEKWNQPQWLCVRYSCCGKREHLSQHERGRPETRSPLWYGQMVAEPRDGKSHTDLGRTKVAGHLNRVTIIGNLGADPEIKTLQTGDKLANMRVAATETWYDKSTGEKKERTEWIRATVWGGLVKVVEQYVKKGSKIYLEGKLQTRKWQAQDGSDRYSTEVVLQGFGAVLILLDGRKPDARADEDAGFGEYADPAPAKRVSAANYKPGAGGQPGDNSDLDTIPF